MSTQDKNYLSQIYDRKIESLKFWIIIQKFIIDHSGVLESVKSENRSLKILIKS